MRSASRTFIRAAPQLIGISLPSGSPSRSLLSLSARSAISSPSAAKDQGWVLCTDGAHTAAWTAVWIAELISSVVRALM